MIYKITGEQPFQVLSDSFSVSPSESGYDLYLSADGINYSNFATVAANTTRQFTGMNNGNYYKLVGNTGEVKVNWERDCHGGGGGGAAGVSSLDGQTGALTTKTINGNSILGSGDIVISGGSGAENYVIVNDLSAITNPVEGMIAFTPAYSASSIVTKDVYKFQKIDASTPGFAFSLSTSGWDPWMPIGFDIYNGGFYDENWTVYIENDDNWHSFEFGYEGGYINYKAHFDPDTPSNSYFLVDKDIFDEYQFTYELDDWSSGEPVTVSTVTETTDTSTVITRTTSRFYQRQGGNWQVVSIPNVYFLEDMSSQEIADLANEIIDAYHSGHRDFTNYTIILNGTTLKYVEVNEIDLVFFAGERPNYVSDWFNPPEIYMVNVYLSSTGDYYANIKGWKLPLFNKQISIDSGGTLQASSDSDATIEDIVTSLFTPDRQILKYQIPVLEAYQDEFYNQRFNYGTIVGAYSDGWAYSGNKTIIIECPIGEDQYVHRFIIETDGSTTWNVVNDIKLYPMSGNQVQTIAVSQAEYDALVQAGTVDPNTLYIII